MQDLAGKVAVITGGASGIGRGIALALAREGASVVVSDLAEGRGHETIALVRELGVAGLFVKCNVTNDNDVVSLHKQVMEHFGQIAILVNNAGTLVAGQFEDIPLADWRRCLEVNFISAVRCTQAFLPELRLAARHGGAHLVSTSSLSALFANEPVLMPYAASKAALISLTETLAINLRPEGIGVTCLCPGAVPTNIAEHATVHGSPDGLGVFAARYVPVRSAEEIGDRLIEAIRSDRFLVTSDDVVQRVQRVRATDPDRFVVAMADFFENSTDFPIQQDCSRTPREGAG